METLLWIHAHIMPWCGWWCAVGLLVYILGIIVEWCGGRLSFGRQDLEAMSDGMHIIPKGPVGIYLLVRYWLK